MNVWVLVLRESVLGRLSRRTERNRQCFLRSWFLMDDRRWSWSNSCFRFLHFSYLSFGNVYFWIQICGPVWFVKIYRSFWVLLVVYGYSECGCCSFWKHFYLLISVPIVSHITLLLQWFHFLKFDDSLADLSRRKKRRQRNCSKNNWTCCWCHGSTGVLTSKKLNKSVVSSFKIISFCLRKLPFCSDFVEDGS